MLKQPDKQKLASQVCPYPLAQHTYGLCGFREELKMKYRPDGPNENAIQLRLSGLQIANPSRTTARLLVSTYLKEAYERSAAGVA
jgi:hypothetical protein